MKKAILFFCISFLPLIIRAQGEVEMADTMRSEGKIYVVVAIALVILLGLVVYLFTIDKKLRKIENHISSKGD